MNFILLFLGMLSAVPVIYYPASPPESIAPGHLPVVLADTKGIVHLVYGQDSTIYYATASGPELHFTKPMAVAVLPDLVVGAKRGPQIAVTDQNMVITAVNRTGDIYAYSLDRSTGRWSSATRINDVLAVAKEGFQAVTGAGGGTFHSVWLDLRGDAHNKIVGSTSRDGGRTWSPNQIIYQSPDGSVCECCRVSITASNKEVYVQFRNWLNGSRDLYLAHSADGGLTYATPRKLGSGTWKLNACPMDGGAVTLSSTGQPLTAWRRDNSLYTCVPGQPETVIATGKNVTMTQGEQGSVLAWDEGGTVWVKPTGELPVAVGKGQIPSLAVTGKTAVCTWEAEGQVMTATVKLATQ